MASRNSRYLHQGKVTLPLKLLFSICIGLEKFPASCWLCHTSQQHGSQSDPHQPPGGLSKTHSPQHQVCWRNAHQGQVQQSSSLSHCWLHQGCPRWHHPLQSGIHRLWTSRYSLVPHPGLHKLLLQAEAEGGHEIWQKPAVKDSRKCSCHRLAPADRTTW